MPLAYEATISCNAENCKTANITGDPHPTPAVAQTDALGKANADGWDFLARLYWCPKHRPNSKEAGK